ncbi:hypothetical protein MEG05_20480 [Vibrio aestuarianus]|uniref:hypothetical protein n=1 Tax=Vibrio aestuarianus TaxID=28171 RepID=UPI00237CBF53|nr:hypothetical protein [Vibrio aestuarianus]MDE1316316.1 hypothetical protein [Vibrio aestuarianus]
MADNVTTFPADRFYSQRSGDGGGNGLEARVAKLESDVEHIKRDISDIKGRQLAFMDRTEDNFKEMRQEFKSVRSETEDNFKEMRQEFKSVRSEMKSDFRMLFGALITVTLGLAGLMAKGFGWL